MRNLFLIATIVLTIGSPVLVAAAERIDADPAADVPEVRLPRSKQLETRRTEFLAQLAILQTEFARETNPETALNLQRKISTHKLNYEIGLHRLQLDLALKSADSAREAEIRATITALEKMLPKSGSPEPKEAGQQ